MEKSLKNSESKEKLVSFVVPVYRTEPYLKACLESLLNQDYKNIEIIPVLDGKSRRARKIIERLKDDRIKEVVEIPHGGACKARNAGFEHTKGDYVSFWDSDCYAELGMVRVWIKTFVNHPEISFCYSGYRFNNPQKTAFNSQPFDEYALTCQNYIATMFPMKRDVFPGFDENLKSLHDWDMWLTIVNKGHKGWYNEGWAFSTEMREGISSKGCSPENWLERYETVREKHGILNRNICFTSASHTFRPLELATIYKQDALSSPSFHPHRYKMIYAIGCYAGNIDATAAAFKGASKDCKRIIHWLGDDVESLFMLPYNIVMNLKVALKETIDKHYCENKQSKDMLAELGIESEILPLPMNVIEVKQPKEFVVYAETDGVYDDLISAVQRACPDIKIESPNMCQLEDFACFLSITHSIMPGENMKRFLAAGRKVVTNYNQLYANTTKPEMEDIIKALRKAKKEWKKGEYNVKAKEYYAKMLDIDEFRKKVIDNA